MPNRLDGKRRVMNQDRIYSDPAALAHDLVQAAIRRADAKAAFNRKDVEARQDQAMTTAAKGKDFDR